MIAWGHGKAGYMYANYRHGADRCSMAGMGVGAGSLKHRCVSPPSGTTAAWQCFVRYTPLCSGWSVPCVSIQLTLSQTSFVIEFEVLLAALGEKGVKAAQKALADKKKKEAKEKSRADTTGVEGDDRVVICPKIEPSRTVSVALIANI